jgi:uncharacterized protein (TIGR01777 family)
MTNNKRTIVIPGGSGFLGHVVADYLSPRGWNVIVLSRGNATMQNVRVIQWDGKSPGAWIDALDGADVVLNLAGKSVNCRYNAANREAIEQSRTQSTSAIGAAIAQAKRPPKVWLNSSTATIYRHAEDRPQDEYSGEIGAGFSVNVALAWEKTFFQAQTPGVRKVSLRSAMVMGRGRGGPFDVFRRLVRMRLGGRMGAGMQRVSWVHVEDFCRAIEFLIDRDDLDGAINIAAPNPPTNEQFMRALRKAAHVRIGLPATRWMLEVGAYFLRTETELPLKSRYVVSTRLQKSGFVFKHPTWEQAAIDLLRT